MFIMPLHDTAHQPFDFEYIICQRWTLNDCVRYLFSVGIMEHTSTPLSIPECPSMEIFRKRRRETRQTTARVLPVAILAPPVYIGMGAPPVSP
jgi:hypothetical protein